MTVWENEYTIKTNFSMWNYSENNAKNELHTWLNEHVGKQYDDWRTRINLDDDDKLILVIRNKERAILAALRFS